MGTEPALQDRLFWSSPAFTEGRPSSVKEQNHEGVNILYSGRIVIVVSELLLQGVEGGFCNRFYWCPIFLPHSSSLTLATAMVAFSYMMASYLKYLLCLSAFCSMEYEDS